ncbi:MAG TPA: helix-turn-helix domain-containing protein, partial [Kofleriaceae bacterium]
MMELLGVDLRKIHRLASRGPIKQTGLSGSIDYGQTCLYSQGMSTEKPEGSARDRLLAAATELFYEEGIHTVGIDRVIERAGVAKASLYSTFGSKDELVRAYLQGRAIARQTRISQRIARHDAPRERLLAIFDLLVEAVAAPTYRGCAFVNASAEGPRGETPVTQVSSESRAWVHELFIQLAREAGASAPELLGRQLVVLYDGGMVGAAMDRDPGAAAQARAMAEALRS